MPVTFTSCGRLELKKSLPQVLSTSAGDLEGVELYTGNKFAV